MSEKSSGPVEDIKANPVVGLAAQRLGVPAGVLWGLSAHPDLVEMVERELAARSDDQDRR